MTSRSSLERQIEHILNAKPTRVAPLVGGCIGDVYRIDLPGDQKVVAKVGNGRHPLSLEGWMLTYLGDNTRLPVPDVLHSADDLLVMSFVEGDSHLTDPVQRHAADLLADLHSISADHFGFERDTLIGPLHQPNPATESWLDFFRDQRLLYMGDEARQAGRLPGRVYDRLVALCGKLDRWLLEPESPSLVHGDMWTTNVLAARGRVTGFLDPAIYFGHAEVELAFSTLFSTFGAPFFERYVQLRALQPGFFEERRDLYNLYPLLVHVRLFGGGYVGSVDRILARFGF